MNSENLFDSQQKYNEVLGVLLEAKNLYDDSYLEKMITYLSKDYLELLKDPSTISFIDQSTSAMQQNAKSMDPKTELFTLKLLAIFVEDQQRFQLIKEKNILERVQDAIKNKQNSGSLRLAHLNILRSTAKHDLGLEWIKATEVWRLAIEYFEENHTVYMLREISSFFFDILMRFAEDMDDDKQCEEILEELMKPLLKYKWGEPNNVVFVDSQNAQKTFIPMLNVVSMILEKCLQSGKRTRIAYYILAKYRLENNLWKFGDITTDHDLIGMIMRNHVLGNYLRLSSMDIPESDTTTKDLDFKVFTTHFYNQIVYLVGRKSFRNIILATEMNHKLWKLLGDRAPSDEIIDHENKIKFGDQVLILQVFPVLFLLKHRCASDNNGHYVEDFCNKILSISCTFTTRTMYAYRDALVANGSHDVIAELAAKSIQGMLSIKDCLKRDRAILTFAILTYLLKEYVPDTKPIYDYAPESKCKRKSNCSANSELLLQTQNLLSTILSALHDLIKNYNINWKECLESTIIVDLMFALLNNPNLSTRLSVQALKLIQISIEHYLTPNLALLLNTLDGSGMENLGPIICKRLHDHMWEVRDSTLELLNSVVEMSEQKYPAFQRHILDSGICPILEAMIKNDSEAYVRASALKCLKSMIQIKLFWDNYIKNTDLLQHCVKILNKESEGLVRKEAVTCITAIYCHQQIPKSFLDTVFAAMVQAAVNDLFWEVKLNALHFWKTVVCRQFQHQGMIDGTFPSVTFSKEHKKIVTLTEKEILLRLQKFLNELALRGCLGVLLSGLKDDSDLEVVKLSVFLVKKIMFHLSKHHYLEEFKKTRTENHSSSSPKPIVDTNYSEYKKDMNQNNSPTTRNNADFDQSFAKNCQAPGKLENLIENCSSDAVIDSIVNLNDMGLLVNAYQNNLSLKDNTDDSDSLEANLKLFNQFKQISGDDFINAVSDMNLDDLIEHKNDWMLQSESFASLLDDILVSIRSTNGVEEEKDNEIDCY